MLAASRYSPRRDALLRRGRVLFRNHLKRTCRWAERPGILGGPGVSFRAMHRLAGIWSRRFAGPWIALVLVTATCQREKLRRRLAISRRSPGGAEGPPGKGRCRRPKPWRRSWRAARCRGTCCSRWGSTSRTRTICRAFEPWGGRWMRLSRAGQHGRAAAAARLQSRSAWSAVRYQDALAALDRCLVESDKAGDTAMSSRALMNSVSDPVRAERHLTGARRPWTTPAAGRQRRPAESPPCWRSTGACWPRPRATRPSPGPRSSKCCSCRRRPRSPSSPGTPT